MQLKHRYLAATLTGLLCLPLIGCGPGKSTVTGKVTLDGTPVSDATIVFIPARGPAFSTEVKNGQYSVVGVPHGEAKVTVDNKVIGQLVAQSKSAGGPSRGTVGPPGGGKGIQPGQQMSGAAKEGFDKQQKDAAEAARIQKELAANYRPVPEKYNAAATSGLTHTVSGASSTFDVQLTSK
jgi:hypothetical protein